MGGEGNVANILETGLFNFCSAFRVDQPFTCFFPLTTLCSLTLLDASDSEEVLGV
jgi:hypothetical protein